MSESDDLRKAIAKKQKEQLLKHQEKFIRGAVERGMPQPAAEGIFKDWEEFARYGFNKCLPAETEVIDAVSGRLVTIGELHARQALIETVTLDEANLRLRTGRVSAVMANGVKPVFRLTTASGRTIEATSNHPFYTLDGWRMLAELNEGEQVAIPRRLSVEGGARWPEHQVIALGHLLAEGNLCHPNSVYFYSQDREQVDDFVRAADAFENVACTVAVHKGTFSVYAKRRERTRRPGIMDWAAQLGILGKNARTKEIPSAAFELSSRQLGLLLSRMWEGDGHIDLAGRSLFYATASPVLARQVQHVLLRLGIFSRVRTVTFPYKEGRVGYQVFVTGNTNLKAFADSVAVHFVSHARRAKLISLTEKTVPVAASTRDIVPLGIKHLVRVAKDRAGVTWHRITAESGVAPREFYPTGAAAKNGFKRETIGGLADYFDDPGPAPLRRQRCVLGRDRLHRVRGPERDLRP
jgi:DNA polymerase-3 subunit alpha